MASQGLKLVQAPSGEPVTLAEAKEYLRIDPEVTDFDGLLGGLVTAARGLLETQTGRQFLTATWRLSLPGFPADDCPIRLPLPPLIDVVTLEYVAEADGVVTAVDAADFQVDSDAEPGELWPAYQGEWPDARAVPRAVRVTYRAGYGAAADVPEGLKTAIKMAAAHWFEHPEAVMPGPFEQLPLAVQSLAMAHWSGEYR